VPGRTRYPGAAQFVPDSRSLPALRKAAADCRGCDLYKEATQTVFGAGLKGARLMLVGEQPGDVEDIEGAPFVGPAGRLLTRAITEAGLEGVPTFVTNAVKHFHYRRQGKRRIHQTPRAGHIAACRPWVAAELAAVRPDLVVCLGSIAAKAVVGNDVRVLRDRGTILEREGTTGPGPFMVTVHPSAILRSPSQDRDAAYSAFVADLKIAAALVA
jgi:DNA polymerase